jgi:hypothetical protein
MQIMKWKKSNRWNWGYRSEISIGGKSLVEKYRAILDWDVPEIDQNIADKFILVERCKALDGRQGAQGYVPFSRAGLIFV